MIGWEASIKYGASDLELLNDGTLAMTWAYRCASRAMGRQGIPKKAHKRGLFMLIGMQGSPIFSAQFGPIAGRKGSWGEPPPGQHDLLDVNQPCWLFRRCLMKRSFYNK